MADHKEEPVLESVMDKITEKFHGGDSSSSSDSDDEKKKGSSSASAAEAVKAKIYRLFGRERPVHSVLGGGKPADLVLWRNKKISGGVLAGATAIWLLFEVMEYHLLTLVCHCLILSLAILFLWSNASTFINKSPPNIPEVKIPENVAVNVALQLRYEINRGFATLREIGHGRDLKKFLIVIAGLWLLSVLGSCCNFLTLFYIVFVARALEARTRATNSCAPSPCTPRSMAAAPAAPGGLMHLRPPPPRCVSPRASASCAPRIWGTPPRLRLRRRRALALAAPSVASAEAEAYTEPELVLLEALLGVQGRGRAVAPRQLQEVESAVQALEALGGIPDPTSSSLIEGSWQLIFTTRPGTASPIQRTFVGVDSFRVFQEVYLRTDDPRVVNVVRFSESVGDLKVEAEATIKDGKRILFRFDRAAFAFKFLPFKVPYPVPFRLLGDEAKGWLDTTYLSHTGNIRISRGNKGTTFVLQKSADARQILLSAISARTGVEEVINDFISSQNGTKTDLSILVGEWQLLWSSQTEGESWSSVASAGLKDFQIIKEDGKLKNSASPFPGFTLNATGNICKKGSGNTFTVSMEEGAVQVGGLQFPLDAQGEFVMEILYIDNKIRISRLNQHMLVHLRIANTT